jgi:hypothetical protein
MFRSRLGLAAMAWLGVLFTAWALGQPAATAVAAPDQAGLPLPSLRAVLSASGRFTLMGVVPDSLERDLIVRRARQLYGADRVTDLLQVGVVGNPAWLGADFLPDLRGASNATAVLENGSLLVEGEVPTRDAMQRIAGRLADLRRRGLTVDSRLRAPDSPAAASTR